jgi:NAD(P)-dependent dehydrogenase (short-subunit alcohol dehydrogenase family)
MRVRFNSFVYVGEQVDLFLDGLEATSCSFHLETEGVTVCRARLKLGPIDSPEEFPACEDAELLRPAEPYERTIEEAAGLTGRIEFSCTEEAVREMFPSACAKLSSARVRSLLATTTLVGMVCPGLHSIYSGLTVTASGWESSPDELRFEVNLADTRFRLVRMKVFGPGVVGTVEAAFRMPPPEQASVTSVAGFIRPDAFKNAVALVVGGTRGLGELAAKLLAVGGAKVYVTYAVGHDDAERVVSEIVNSGGRAESFHYDVRLPAATQLSDIASEVTDVYYFATPQIFRRKSALFVRSLYEEFHAFYVTGFFDLIQCLIADEGRKISVFYPSSIAVEERPSDMTEYAMAKAAGEVLCADLNKFEHRVRVIVSRLPRILTDQTSTIVEVATADPISLLVEAIEQTSANGGPAGDRRG